MYIFLGYAEEAKAYKLKSDQFYNQNREVIGNGFSPELQGFLRAIEKSALRPIAFISPLQQIFPVRPRFQRVMGQPSSHLSLAQ